MTMQWALQVSVALLNIVWIAFFLTPEPFSVFVQKRNTIEEILYEEFCIQPPAVKIPANKTNTNPTSQVTSAPAPGSEPTVMTGINWSRRLQVVLLNRGRGLQVVLLNWGRGLLVALLNRGRRFQVVLLNRGRGLQVVLLNRGRRFQVVLLNRGRGLQVVLLNRGRRLQGVLLNRGQRLQVVPLYQSRGTSGFLPAVALNCLAE
ncbi:uncharacterized protein LOC120573386 [Perca fluviatilis]|uniref:uncharacterized protein LOC120573386 n=1 Tax=Perca fluviatilis TaxID=8168 RepID=UPI00196494C8|nr:uncharacterized protein LOC120573386 [Perca fluviatilis]